MLVCVLTTAYFQQQVFWHVADGADQLARDAATQAGARMLLGQVLGPEGFAVLPKHVQHLVRKRK